MCSCVLLTSVAGYVPCSCIEDMPLSHFCCTYTTVLSRAHTTCSSILRTSANGFVPGVCIEDKLFLLNLCCFLLLAGKCLLFCFRLFFRFDSLGVRRSRRIGLCCAESRPSTAGAKSVLSLAPASMSSWSNFYLAHLSCRLCSRGVH